MRTTLIVHFELRKRKEDFQLSLIKIEILALTSIHSRVA